MATTIFVSEATRDQLAATKALYGAKSIDEVLNRLLRDAAPTAQDLFRRNKKKVLAACKRNGVTKLVAFGSRVRDDRTPTSDLDLVADFVPGTSLLDLVRTKRELSEAFGCPVDLGDIPDPGTRLADRIAKEGVALVG